MHLRLRNCHPWRLFHFGVFVVDGMSDGTRDQLYLSLRLATLEQHLSKGEPMPFVVDDILIGFDDNRTRVL